MACACGGGTPAPNPSTSQYLVKLANGNVKTVTGEANARIEITMAGGGTYSVIK